jgi:hypothetical protein
MAGLTWVVYAADFLHAGGVWSSYCCRMVRAYDLLSLRSRSSGALGLAGRISNCMAHSCKITA